MRDSVRSHRAAIVGFLDGHGNPIADRAVIVGYPGGGGLRFQGSLLLERRWFDQFVEGRRETALGALTESRTAKPGMPAVPPDEHDAAEQGEVGAVYSDSARAGKSIRVEKPLAMVLPGLLRVVDAMRAEDVDWLEFLGDRPLRPFRADVFSC